MGQSCWLQHWAPGGDLRQNSCFDEDGCLCVQDACRVFRKTLPRSRGNQALSRYVRYTSILDHCQEMVVVRGKGGWQISCFVARVLMSTWMGSTSRGQLSASNQRRGTDAPFQVSALQTPLLNPPSQENRDLYTNQPTSPPVSHTLILSSAKENNVESSPDHSQSSSL